MPAFKRHPNLTLSSYSLLSLQGALFPSVAREAIATPTLCATSTLLSCTIADMSDSVSPQFADEGWRTKLACHQVNSYVARV